MSTRARLARGALLVLAAFGASCAGGTESPPTPAKPSGGAGSGGTSANVIVVAPGGCAGPTEPAVAPSGTDPLCATTSAAVSFQHDVAALVGCSGEVCHQAWSYATLVERPSTACCDHRLLVDPGHPSSSHLVQAVSDVDSCVGRMGDLDAQQVATIVAWICQGAQND